MNNTTRITMSCNNEFLLDSNIAVEISNYCKISWVVQQKFLTKDIQFNRRIFYLNIGKKARTNFCEIICTFVDFFCVKQLRIVLNRDRKFVI